MQLRSTEQLGPWPKGRERSDPQVCDNASKIYDIFEGTEQIQQLVIARAISGRHIA